MGSQALPSPSLRTASRYFWRFKKLHFQEKESRTRMAIVWLLLFVVTTATVQTTVGTKASEREDLDLDFSVVDYIEANANATERNAKEIQKLKDASRMCQTGFTRCVSCGGNDPDGSRTKNYVKYSINFDPYFDGTPTVSMGTSELWMHTPDGEEGDSWGFFNYAQDVSASGFTAVLMQDDINIEDHGAIWIACGKVNV